MQGVLPALVLSSLAGMSTAIGGFSVLFPTHENSFMPSFSLGFAAGVMIQVSMGELLPDAGKSLSRYFGPFAGIAVVLSLAVGLLTAFLINRLVPDGNTAQPQPDGNSRSELARVGIVTAIAVTIHNFPEGIATFMAGYADLRLGLPVAISIALHNIPEGVSVAMPVYYGTGSRFKGFLYSALSGLTEPLGALLAYALLAPFLNDVTLGVIFGAVAGIMVFISFEGLIPSSRKVGRAGASAVGIFAGLALMQAVMTAFSV